VRHDAEPHRALGRLSRGKTIGHMIMRLWKMLSLSALLPSTVLLAQQPLKVMTRVEVVLEGPDIPAGSFATKPKVMYRAGSRYCRTEEAPDTERGIHGLAIVNEPDYWMVNLMKNTAARSRSGPHVQLSSAYIS